MRLTTLLPILTGLGLVLGASVPSASAAPAIPDVAVDIAPLPAALMPGNVIHFDISVRNAGTANANNVTLNVDLPTDSVWHTVTPSFGSCAFGPFSPTDDVRCFFGTLVPAATATVRVVVHPYRTTQAGTARVTTTDPESAYGNNSDTESVVLPAVGVSDLEIKVFEDLPDPLRVGGLLTYRILVNNIGDDSARDVVVTDLLPPNVRFVNAWTTAGPSCAHVPTGFGEAVMCKLYTINNAANATAWIQVQPLSPGLVFNTVGVGLSTVDPLRIQNNSATARTYVNP